MEKLVFSWSLDGFGSELFRTASGGEELFRYRYTATNDGENAPGARCDGVLEYHSFEEFWKEFTEQPLWLSYCPLFIERECRPFLQKFFTHIDTGRMTMAEYVSYCLWMHKIEQVGRTGKKTGTASSM